MQTRPQLGPQEPAPANDNEPLTPVARGRRQNRCCLNCGNRFRSLGAFHRICDACKADEYWQSGEDMTLHLPSRRQVGL